MSLPITAVGPLNVLMKPILTLRCCADAGIAASKTSAVVARKSRFMLIPPIRSVALPAILKDRSERQKPPCAKPKAQIGAPALPLAYAGERPINFAISPGWQPPHTKEARHERFERQAPRARAHRRKSRRLRQIRPAEDPVCPVHGVGRHPDLPRHRAQKRAQPADGAMETAWRQGDLHPAPRHRGQM